MTGETKPGDPADRAADGAFGGVHSHRAGYGDDKLARLVAWLRDHPTTTLASGEGALLLAEIDRLHAAAKDSMDHYTDARAEINRLGRIIGALVEPSKAVSRVAWEEWHLDTKPEGIIRAAVAAAEREVGG